VTYDYARRQDAKWKLNDIITMRVYTLARSAFPQKFIISTWGDDDNKTDPVYSTKYRPAAMLTKEQFDEGMRVFVDFYKNGTLVHWPIQVNVGPNIPCFIALKFCELKDCVEIVHTPPTVVNLIK
jgi:hypothetical protein